MSDLIAIEWQGTQLAALEGAVHKGSVRVRDGFIAVPPEGLDVDEDPRRAGEWLAEELKKKGLASKQVAVVVPREGAVLRRIDLPDVSDDELPDLVSLQAATVMSTPLDRMLIDFVPLPRVEGSATRAVLLATVVKERVDALRAALTAAGRELAHIGLAPAATAELVGRLRAERNETEGAAVAIVQHDRRVEISLLKQRALILAHSVTLHGESATQDESRVLAELSRSLIPLHSVLGNNGVTQAWVAGVTPALERAIAERFHCEVERLELTSVPGVAFDTAAPHPDARYAGATGALLAAAGGMVEAFDFLAPRRPPVKQDHTKKRWIIAAAAVAAASLLLVIGLKVWQFKLDGRIEEMQAKDGEMTRLLADGEPMMQSYRLLRTWEDGQVDWLDQFAQITKQLPGTSRTYLADLHLKPQATKDSTARIEATGYAKERHDAEEVKSNMARADYRVIPREVITSTKDSAYPWQVKVEMDLMPPGKPNTPASAAAKAQPATRKVGPR